MVQDCFSAIHQPPSAILIRGEMFKKIVVIGLGLMGGSLAAACRKRFPGARIVGITRNSSALVRAMKKKWIHEGTSDIALGASDAEVVILCTPVGTYLPILKKIDRVCKKDALVMDVGSVKASVVAEVNRTRWKNLSFVGCHPMAGSHDRGIEAAHPSLYDGGLILLTKDPKTCPRSLKQARQFWGHFSNRIAELSPAMHDQLIGQVSHLPHAVAVCLVHAIAPSALKFAATGFRDTTRIAASDSSIWEPIFKANRKVLLASLRQFERSLAQFRSKLQAKDPIALIRFLDKVRKKRGSV